MLTDKQIDALFERGNNFIRLGNFLAATKDYTQVIEHRPQFAPAYFNRAFARQHGPHDLTGAIADYTAALTFKGDFAEAYANRAIAYRQVGNLDACLDDYTAAIRLNPPMLHTIYNNRGEAHFLCRHYSAALADFQQAHTLREGYRFALAGMAIAYYKLGDTKQAHHLWRDLIHRNENFAKLEWVAKELGWDTPLVETAHQILGR